MSVPFADLPDAADIDVWLLPNACGLTVNWALTGFGFGQIIIRRDVDSGDWSVDDEHTSPQTTAAVLGALKVWIDRRPLNVALRLPDQLAAYLRDKWRRDGPWEAGVPLGDRMAEDARVYLQALLDDLDKP